MKPEIPLADEDISILEDSRYFVNRSVEALNIQLRRLENYNSKNPDDFWDYLADVHFYIVALKRLRQSMLVGKKIDRLKAILDEEFDAFDKTTADVMKMRHVLEHIDEYMKNSGRNKEIKNSTLYTIYHDNGVLNWAGLKFDRYKIHAAAEKIVKKYREITSREFKSYKEENEAMDVNP